MSVEVQLPADGGNGEMADPETQKIQAEGGGAKAKTPTAHGTAALSPFAQTIRQASEQQRPAVTGGPPPLPLPGAAVPADKDKAKTKADGTAAATSVVKEEERYRIVRTIGEGGMGRVVEAIDERFGRRVAVKELLEDARSPEWEARFGLEAVVTANLEHPGVPGVHDRGWRSDGAPYYVMRLVEGRPLDEAIKRCKTMRDRLALLPAVISAAQTLAFAHERGVVHRDVKPQNILVGRHGQTVVVDWGIAKVRGVNDDDDEPLETIGGSPLTPSAPKIQLSKDVKDVHESSKTKKGSVFGTPGYMAPEQALGQVDHIDERTDVFALGALLYHVLAGTAPYASTTMGESLALARMGTPPSIDFVAPDAPESLRKIVQRAMAPMPDDRFASAAEVATALESFTTESLVAKPSRAIEYFASGISVVLIAIFGLLALLLVVSRQADFVEMGAFSIAFTVIAGLGCSISVIELRTHGKHRLSPLVIAMMVATMLGAITNFLIGLANGLGMALKDPALVADTNQRSLLIIEAIREAIGNVAWGAILCTLQVILWAVARRRVMKSEK